jgi:hypothetical protein
MFVIDSWRGEAILWDSVSYYCQDDKNGPLGAVLFTLVEGMTQSFF